MREGKGIEKCYIVSLNKNYAICRIFYDIFRMFVTNKIEMTQKFELDEPTIVYSTLDDKNAFSLIKAIKEGIHFTFFVIINRFYRHR